MDGSSVSQQVPSQGENQRQRDNGETEEEDDDSDNVEESIACPILADDIVLMSCELDEYMEDVFDSTEYINFKYLVDFDKRRELRNPPSSQDTEETRRSSGDRARAIVDDLENSI